MVADFGIALDRGPVSRLTFEGEFNTAPSWPPDGRWVSWVSRRGGRVGVWRKRSDGVGSAEEVMTLDRDVQEARWSKDGDWLVLSVSGPPSQGILAMRLGTEDSTPVSMVDGPANELHAAVSPDGRWLAYASDESGRREVYVRPFPAVDEGKWQMSTDGGVEPLWSPDARSLYFRNLGGDRIEVVDMSLDPSSATRRLLLQLPANFAFEQNPNDRLFDILPTGDRFVMIRQGEGDRSGKLVIVLNFFEELRAKVGRE